jgi:integrase/recombinase XerD
MPFRGERQCDERFREVIEFWRRNGLKPGTAAVYGHWIRAFRKYCRQRKLKELHELTLAGSRRFASYYTRHHQMRRPAALEWARDALHAWSHGLGASGFNVPVWKPSFPPQLAPVPLVRQFIDYRRRHAGRSVSTLRQDQRTSLELLEFLRSRNRTCRTVRLPDIDAFALKLRRRMGVIALARQLTSARAFLRFLHVSGRLRFDLAASVVKPSLKRDSRPPRALPWSAVRRILNAVDTSSHTGRRNYAILLLMSVYGLGGAEVVALRLEDIDWDRKTIRVCRPKTQATILLPLLPQAARAVASYLQHSRPNPCRYRQVFIRRKMPYVPLADSTFIRCMLTQYARKAGVTSGHLGSHVLRHSQATRQVELGASLKIVGDILGHRDPRATSHYTHSAVRRLRDLALPLPHA